MQTLSRMRKNSLKMNGSQQLMKGVVCRMYRFHYILAPTRTEIQLHFYDPFSASYHFREIQKGRQNRILWRHQTFISTQRSYNNYTLLEDRLIICTNNVTRTFAILRRQMLLSSETLFLGSQPYFLFCLLRWRMKGKRKCIPCQHVCRDLTNLSIFVNRLINIFILKSRIVWINFRAKFPNDICYRMHVRYWSMKNLMKFFIGLSLSRMYQLHKPNKDITLPWNCFPRGKLFWIVRRAVCKEYTTTYIRCNYKSANRHFLLFCDVEEDWRSECTNVFLLAFNLLYTRAHTHTHTSHNFLFIFPFCPIDYIYIYMSYLQVFKAEYSDVEGDLRNLTRYCGQKCSYWDLICYTHTHTPQFSFHVFFLLPHKPRQPPFPHPSPSLSVCHCSFFFLIFKRVL